MSPLGVVGSVHGSLIAPWQSHRAVKERLPLAQGIAARVRGWHGVFGFVFQLFVFRVFNRKPYITGVMTLLTSMT